MGRADVHRKAGSRAFLFAFRRVLRWLGERTGAYQRGKLFSKSRERSMSLKYKNRFDFDTSRGSRRILASDLRRVQLSSRFANRPVVVKADRGHPCLEEWEKVLDCYHRSEYTDPPCIQVLKAFDNCSEVLGEPRTYMRELSQLRFHLREMGKKQRQMSFGPPVKV